MCPAHMKLPAPVAIFGMILFGTACSLLAKLIYSVRGATIYGETATYEKPWLQVVAMFAGMSLCVVLDLPRTSRRTRPSSSPSDQQPHSSVWIICIPALFDLFATACGTTGLLYTSVSVYQMLRGAMLIFTALLSVVFLRRRLTTLNYVGILFCVLGIAFVGIANIFTQNTSASRSDTLFGFCIILAGQVLQAAQVVIEEFLLQDLRMSSVRVVAWEGIFGLLHCFLWVLPLVHFLPGKDHGHLEDVVNGMYMLTHSLPVAAIIVMDMIMMLFYNVFAMEVTDSLSAVHRVVIETLRTVAVWLSDLIIFYLFSDGRLGEAWTSYSYLQLIGFSLLVVGTVLYNFENLKIDYDKQHKKAATKLPLLVSEPDAVGATQYESIETAIPVHVATPIAVDVDTDDESDEEELAGSFYGHTLGSVAHSPFLVAAATPPTSFSSSLRHRSYSSSHH